MLRVHQEAITSNLSVLVERTDLNALVPELLAKGVFNQRMIDRILNPCLPEKRIKTNLYLEVRTRGPEAFNKLKEALVASNHRDLAFILASTDPDQSTMIHHSSSLYSLASEPSSENDCEGDGPLHSTQKAVPRKSVPAKRPDTLPGNMPATSSGYSSNQTSDVRDFQSSKSYGPAGKVFAAATYGVKNLGETLGKLDVHSSEKNKSVFVTTATHWQEESPNKPKIYKMNSNPRGCALIINNKEFHDKSQYPTRTGSENDVIRFSELLVQLHFSVEHHEDKTKMEMEEIVKNFSKKSELPDSDCIWITIMSHGEEGDSDDNHEIIGVDGYGCKSKDIIACFFSDACPAAIGKPKLFFLHSCRGPLTDPGVTITNTGMNLCHRTVTDGKRVNFPNTLVKVRKQSDIFVVYPTTEGFAANRDVITGTWFIQTVVDVFSEHAHNTHLDDLIKLVDERIKRINNPNSPNFQSVETKSIGWSKHLYFNPGLCKDWRGDTVYIGKPAVTTPMDEGLDVVDVSSTNSDRSPNGAMYLKFKDDKGTDSEQQEEKETEEEKSGCFNILACKPI